MAGPAARSAYYAAFHAAEAVIFDKTGRVANTHRGVKTEFARASKDDPHLPDWMPTFLARAYRYKEISEYSVDPKEVVTMQNADDALRGATEFIELVREALA